MVLYLNEESEKPTGDTLADVHPPGYRMHRNLMYYNPIEGMKIKNLLQPKTYNDKIDK